MEFNEVRLVGAPVTTYSEIIMTKPVLTIMALSVATLGLAACESWPTNKPPGTYETKTESTNAYGTKTTTDQKTHVYRDPYGNKRAVTETETTRDPKGLFNKETSKTVESYN